MNNFWKKMLIVLVSMIIIYFVYGVVMAFVVNGMYYPVVDGIDKCIWYGMEVSTKVCIMILG